MGYSNNSFLGLLTIISVLLVVGCSAPPSTPDPNTRTSLETTSGMIEVTFDGKGCLTSGPLELPTGTNSILFRNLTDGIVDLYAPQLIDGHTIQDLRDSQGEPGDYVSITLPGWVIHHIGYGGKIDTENDGEVYSFLMEEEGYYVLELWGHKPSTTWFCAPIWVIEDPTG